MLLSVGTIHIVRGAYEEIRNFGRCDNTSLGSVIATDLGSIFSVNTIPADGGKRAEFFAVSIGHRTQRDFYSPTAAGYPRVPGK